jgi:hypothetical protein
VTVWYGLVTKKIIGLSCSNKKGIMSFVTLIHIYLIRYIYINRERLRGVLLYIYRHRSFEGGVTRHTLTNSISCNVVVTDVES